MRVGHTPTLPIRSVVTHGAQRADTTPSATRRGDSLRPRGDRPLAGKVYREVEQGVTMKALSKPTIALGPQQTTHEPQPLAVSAKQLAGMLDLSVRTIRTMDAAGKLPRGIRIGRSVRWPVDELRAWLDAGCPDRASWEAISRNGGAAATPWQASKKAGVNRSRPHQNGTSGTRRLPGRKGATSN